MNGAGGVHRIDAATLAMSTALFRKRLFYVRY